MADEIDTLFSDKSGADHVRRILQRARLEVAGTRISVEKQEPCPGIHPEALVGIDRQVLVHIEDVIQEFSTEFDERGILRDDRLREILAKLADITSNARDTSQSLGPSSSVGGGFLHKALHKSLHKRLHKALHKGLHKSAFLGGNGAAGAGLDWPVIEVPWRELTRLYKCRDDYRWDRFRRSELPPPPPVKERLDETRALRELQIKLREPENAFRRDRIQIEASNDLTAYMLPLGANASSPASATAIMFQTILWLASLIGLLYKERFNAPRPHQLDPTLEPFIPVPVYSSYPSNHAFQSYLIAEVFARAVPEHPGVPALHRAAGEVARNREWAGLHIRSDTTAGQTLARLCAPMFEKILQEQIRDVRSEWLGEG
ncbi:hypothetical protein SAMN05421759_103237 [Roseivivax lentus]|uniref:PAP2 superfamily protein n=1 Tax=Roseivivax lentus TaxID=633194 RepID=A0A1N7LXF2_9RHOB|nr:hypothetical protein [Roseivivax lentus]SIS78449.1 hypothetical protein SAMN05421759_103237 [Roseivivax lentus]